MNCSLFLLSISYVVSIALYCWIDSFSLQMSVYIDAGKAAQQWTLADSDIINTFLVSISYNIKARP
jgi:hypothetical protein